MIRKQIEYFQQLKELPGNMSGLKDDVDIEQFMLELHNVQKCEC